MARGRRVLVVGGGVAGLATALELVQRQIPVDIVAATALRRSHVPGAPAGLNAALAPGDSARAHAADSLRAGGYLGCQRAVLAMAEAAPAIVHGVTRLGVPLQRRPDGELLLRKLPGSTAPRTAWAGADTAASLVNGLDAELHRYELESTPDASGSRKTGEPLLRRFEGWDLCELVLDAEGTCVGCVAQELRTMDVRAFRGEAVVVAESGPSLCLGQGACGVPSAEGVLGASMRAGAVVEGPEFVGFYPAAVVGADRTHPVTALAFGEGARLWVPRDRRERRGPEEIAEREREYLGGKGEDGLASMARAVWRACREGRGVYRPERDDNRACVYLDFDAERRDVDELRRRLGGLFDLHDGRSVELEVAPRRSERSTAPRPLLVTAAPGRLLGGLRVTWPEGEARSTHDLETTVPGLYAVGPLAAGLHGAGVLAGDELVGELFGARLAASAIVARREASRGDEAPASTFDAPESAVRAAAEAAREREGDESPYGLADELAELVGSGLGFERDNGELERVATALEELASRLGSCAVPDRATRANQAVAFVRHLASAITVARAMAAAARRRDESRGGHFKPAFPARDDDHHLRVTLAVARRDGSVELVRDAGEAGGLGDVPDTTAFPPEPPPAPEPAAEPPPPARTEGAKKKKRAGKRASEATGASEPEATSASEPEATSASEPEATSASEPEAIDEPKADAKETDDG